MAGVQVGRDVQDCCPAQAHTAHRARAEPTLAPGWQAAFDHSTGHWYYYNTSTGQSVWNPPCTTQSDGAVPHPQPPISTSADYSTDGQAHPYLSGDGAGQHSCQGGESSVPVARNSSTDLASVDCSEPSCVEGQPAPQAEPALVHDAAAVQVAPSCGDIEQAQSAQQHQQQAVASKRCIDSDSPDTAECNTHAKVQKMAAGAAPGTAATTGAQPDTADTAIPHHQDSTESHTYPMAVPPPASTDGQLIGWHQHPSDLTAPSTAAGPPPPAMTTPASPSPLGPPPGWYYRDPQGTTFGPFSKAQLRGWRAHLPMDLLVWFDDGAGGSSSATAGIELAELLGDGELLEQWQSENPELAGGPGCCAPPAPVYEEQCAAAHDSFTSYAQVVLEALPPDDEAVQLARLAASAGKSLKEVLDFSYEASAAVAAPRHKGGYTEYTVTAYHSAARGRVAGSAESAGEESVYADTSSWCNPAELERHLQERGKRRAPPKDWKKLKERKEQHKKKQAVQWLFK